VKFKCSRYCALLALFFSLPVYVHVTSLVAEFMAVFLLCVALFRRKFVRYGSLVRAPGQ